MSIEATRCGQASCLWCQRTRPKFSQQHPAMRTARNIVSQILEEAGADVATCQRINDDCDQFVAWMLEQYATRGDA